MGQEYYEVSFVCNGVYCTNLVQAGDIETAKTWFVRHVLSKDEQFVGITKCRSEIKPGEPIHIAR